MESSLPSSGGGQPPSDPPRANRDEQKGSPSPALSVNESVQVVDRELSQEVSGDNNAQDGNLMQQLAEFFGPPPAGTRFIYRLTGSIERVIVPNAPVAPIVLPSLRNINPAPLFGGSLTSGPTTGFSTASSPPVAGPSGTKSRAPRSAHDGTGSGKPPAHFISASSLLLGGSGSPDLRGQNENTHRDAGLRPPKLARVSTENQDKKFSFPEQQTDWFGYQTEDDEDEDNEKLTVQLDVKSEPDWFGQPKYDDDDEGGSQTFASNLQITD